MMENWASIEVDLLLNILTKFLCMLIQIQARSQWLPLCLRRRSKRSEGRNPDPEFIGANVADVMINIGRAPDGRGARELRL